MKYKFPNLPDYRFPADWLTSFLGRPRGRLGLGSATCAFMPPTDVPFPLTSMESIPALSRSIPISSVSSSSLPPKVKSLLLSFIVTWREGAVFLYHPEFQAVYDSCFQHCLHKSQFCD